MSTYDNLQEVVRLPYLIENGILMIATPDGLVYDIPLEGVDEKEVRDALGKGSFWLVVFQSLVKHLNQGPSKK